LAADNDTNLAGHEETPLRKKCLKKHQQNKKEKKHSKRKHILSFMNDENEVVTEL